MRFEEASRLLRDRLLRVFAEQHIEPATAVLAMADVIALSAVEADISLGQPASLNDRLHELNRRIEQTYAIAYRQMSARRTLEPAGATK